MSKKDRSPAKKENTFGSMGRILFYSVALIVACLAVAVVLFETEAGQEIVAKVRGRRTSSTRAGVKPTYTETKHSENTTNKESSEPTIEERAKSDESALPRGDSVLKDTSAKPSDNTHEAPSSESRNSDNRESNEARKKNTASESTTETTKENSREFEDKPRVDEATSSKVSGDSSNEKKAREIIDEKIDEEEQGKPVEDENKPVEEPVFVDNVESSSEKDVGQTEGSEKKEQEISEEREMEKEQDRNVDESKQSKSEEDEIVGKKQEEKSDKKDVEQEVDGGKVEQEEGIKVGDSLAELEKQRTIEQKEEEERYEPIPEPEGPPIDLSPVNARRGLRGDYGGKDCKDEHKHCAPWARIGECDKNPVWMHVNCKRSCNVCSCSDNDIKCGPWAQTGECKKNAEWMNKNCMKSCKQC